MFAMILIMGQLMTGAAQIQTAAKGPRLNRTSLTLTVGKSKRLTVRNAKNVKWSSSNKAVAVVSGKGKNILVAYFSWSGTSEGIAKNIIKQTGADAYRIERKVPYSDDYATVGYGDAKTEADTNARPEIKNAPNRLKKKKNVCRRKGEHWI